MEPTATEEHGGESNTGTVTVSITRRVRSGREREFEQLLPGLTREVSRFPGFLGVRVFRPPRGGREYRIVVRFDDALNLRAWEESEERRIWNDRIATLIEDELVVADITGTSQARDLRLALTPLEGFVRTSISGLGLLALGTVLAIIAANSPFASAYERFWQTELTIEIGGFAISESLRHWVNDGLMALFFFILGLEIKRELLVGELRYPRLAALPIAAAVGGAVIPALIYAALNWGGEGFRGWGIPMATDAAFSLGALSLLGGRVRPLLLVFLTAFAIVDDILAVLVIAVFYTETISWMWLGVTAVLLIALIVANAAGVHRWPVYGVLGLGVWLALFESGIHATLAGVLVAMTVPARAWINPSEFLARARNAIDDFEAACYMAPTILSNEPQQRATQELEHLCEEVETPMTHLQHKLNPIVAFGILPLFAFANAGVPLGSGLGQLFSNPVAWGVIVGLVVGKPLGITLFSWLAVRLGIAIMPGAFTWRQILGVGWLGGIGFTISLFVAELAFGASPLGDAARVGILIGSVVAGTIGFFILRTVLPPSLDEESALPPVADV